MHEESNEDNKASMTLWKKLPQDLINNHLGPMLDPKTLSIIPSVAKEWHSMFSNPAIWKEKLIKDFQIPIQYLNNFMEKLPQEIASPKLYKIIYKNLLELTRNEQLMINPIYLSFAARDKENLFYLLACCTNDPNIFTQIIPKEERLIWLQLALYSSVNTIFQSLAKNSQHFFKINESINLDELWLCTASRAANEEAMKFLLDKKNGFVFQDFRWMLQCAINNALYANKAQLLITLNDIYKAEFNESFLYKEYHITPEVLPVFFGDINLLKQFFITEPGDKEFIQDLFNMCLFTKNKKLINYFTDPANNTKATIDGATLITAAFIAYTSGSTDVLYQLVSAMNHEELQAILEPNLHGLLYCAASRGDLRLVKYLVEQYAVQPDQEILDVTRNPSTLTYLLNIIQQWGLPAATVSFDVCQLNVSASFSIVARTHGIKPTQQILDDVAAYSLADVQFILDKKQGFNLSPHEETFLSAFKKRNMPVVRFLLDPSQQFNLKITEQTIATALGSESMKRPPILENDDQYRPLTDVVTNAIVDVVRCEITLQTALESLKQNNFASTQQDLEKAQELSESHTIKFLTYIKQNPNIYELQQSQIEFLRDYTVTHELTSQYRLT